MRLLGYHMYLGSSHHHVSSTGVGGGYNFSTKGARFWSLTGSTEDLGRRTHLRRQQLLGEKPPHRSSPTSRTSFRPVGSRQRFELSWSHELQVVPIGEVGARRSRGRRQFLPRAATSTPLRDTNRADVENGKPAVRWRGANDGIFKRVLH